METQINKELYEELYSGNWFEGYKETIQKITITENIMNILVNASNDSDLLDLYHKTAQLHNKLQIDLNTYDYYSSYFCPSGCEIG